MSPSRLEIPEPRGSDYAELTYHASGSEAEVYTAVYVPTGQRVALKVLSPRAGAAASRERRERRFVREASLLREAGGPHVARVYEVLGVRLRGEPTKAFSMEWLPETFRDLVGRQRQGMPLEELERYLRETIEGLAALHSGGVAVRDVRPENLLLSERGELKIADLGMARTDDSAASLVESSRYVAPEVLDGTIRGEYGGEDPPASAYFPSDVYGVGLIFYEAAVGAERWEGLAELRTVFGTEGPGAGMPRNKRWEEWQKDRTLRLPSIVTVRGELPDALSRAIDGMVAKERGERLDLAGVRSILGGLPVRPEPPGRPGPSPQRQAPAPPKKWWPYVVTGLALIGLLIIGAWLVVGPEREDDPPPNSEAGASPPAPPPLPPKTVPLRVETDPSEAEVYVDGLLKGLSPVELGPLEAGRTYEVMLRRGGYKEWKEKWEAGASMPRLHVVMEKRAPAQPPPAVAEGPTRRREEVAPPARPQPRAGEQQEWTIRGARFAFRWIPPGETRIGSPEDEPGRYDDEERYTVRFTRGFWMQETEVTQRQWEAVMGPPNPSWFKKGGQHPVESVSWHRASEFCAELARLTRSPYRLPNEAEWEYAARAGSELPFGRPCTDYREDTAEDEARCLDRIGWYQGNSANRTHTPCERPVEPNDWGLCDMLGNVWEWVEDTYVPKARYSTDLVVDPRPVQGGPGRVLRGGSWSGDPADLRAAYRCRYVPDFRLIDVGFRCARDAE
jgi:formylglycine-generating enzyme required for sulfatase activity/serine/threonine protein kinase